MSQSDSGQSNIDSMTPSDQTRAHDASRDGFEAHVVLRLEAVDPCPEDVLEDISDQVLAVIERGAADVALGPVIAWNVDTYVIEVDFTVEATSNAEVHHKIGNVIGLLETEHGDRVAQRKIAEWIAQLKEHRDD